MPLFRVAGVVEGHRSLGAAEHSLLGVPQDVRVGRQDISCLLAEDIRHGSSFRCDRTEQVVALQLPNLATVLQPGLLCYLGW